MKVMLLEHTPNFEKTCAMAAKLCYSNSDIDNLEDTMPGGRVKSLIDKIVSAGHLSCVEHASVTFGIEGVSRALSHQLVRHRLASYSQQSQRYVRMNPGFSYVVPKSISDHNDIAFEYAALMERVQNLYNRMSDEGIPNEDARYVLPNATRTKLVMTMNARELLHFFSKRCCRRAQWEIRDMAWRMLRICKRVGPNVFKYAGPPCFFGECTEDSMSCGGYDEREIVKLLT